MIRILLATLLLLAACAPRDYPCGPEAGEGTGITTSACGRCIKARGSLPRCLNPAYAVPMHCVDKAFDPNCK